MGLVSLKEETPESLWGNSTLQEELSSLGSVKGRGEWGKR